MIRVASWRLGGELGIFFRVGEGGRQIKYRRGETRRENAP